MIDHAAFLYLGFWCVGIFAGFCSGLLGVGGGAVIVPGLVLLFRYQGIPDSLVMQLAVGTSLATITVATLRGMFSFYRPGIEFLPILKQFLPGLIVGVVGGALLGHYVHGPVTETIFSSVLILIAGRMIFFSSHVGSGRLPGRFGLSIFSGITGVMSGLCGLGGGTLVVPFLTYCRVDHKRTQMVALASSVVTSVFGVITMFVVSFHRNDLPDHTIGYIYWPAWLLLVFGALLVVPLGTALAHRVKVSILRKFFGFFLLAVACHLIISSM